MRTTQPQIEMDAVGQSSLPLKVSRGLRIQHTFITVTEEDDLVDIESSTQRRASSVPRSWRPFANDDEAGKQAKSGITVSSELVSSESLQHAYCDTSTEEGASVVCTDLDASDADALSEEVETAPWITGYVLAQMLLSKESLAEIAADEEYMQQSLPMVPSNRAAGQTRVKLNSQAKAWVPSSESVTAMPAVIPPVVAPQPEVQVSPQVPAPPLVLPRLPEPPLVAWPPPGTTLAPTVAVPAMRCSSSMVPAPPNHLDQQFHNVVASAKAALEKTGIAQHVEVVEMTAGWRIVGTLKQTDAWRKEQLCAQVKEALLSAAEASQSVYVLGYAWNPFQLTERGFTAVLCNCSNTFQACWDVLKYGQCQRANCRGGHCPFQHPSQRWVVGVELVPENP